MKLGNRKKATLINIFFKYGQLCLSMVIGIVLVPYYLQFISVAEYGIWLAVGSTVLWFAAADPGVANVTIQKVSHALGSSNERLAFEYAIAGIVFSCFFALLAAFLGFILSPFLVSLMVDASKGYGNINILYLVSYCIFSLCLIMFGYGVVGVAQALGHAAAVGMLYIISMIINIILVIIFLRNGYGVFSFAYAQFLSSTFIVLAALLLLIIMYRKNLFTIRNLKLERIKELLSLFGWGFGARFIKIFSNNVDNFLILKYLGASQVAMYNFTSMASKQMENIINQPISAFRPALASVAGEGQTAKIKKYLILLIVAITWIAGLIFTGLVLFNEIFVALWVGEKNFSGSHISLLLALFFLSNVFVKSFGTFCFSFGDIKKSSMMEWLSALILIPMLFFGVYIWGLEGLVMAHIAANLFFLSWYYPVSLQRFVSFSRKDFFVISLEVVKVVLCSLVIIFVFKSIIIKSWLELIIFAMLVVCLFLFGMLVVSGTIRNELMTLISSRKRKGIS